jgi:hypothetical protein
MTAKVAEYNRIAAEYLQHPPEPRLSVLAIAWYQKSLTVEPNCAETYLALAKANRTRIPKSTLLSLHVTTSDSLSEPEQPSTLSP